MMIHSTEHYKLAAFCEAKPKESDKFFSFGELALQEGVKPKIERLFFDSGYLYSRNKNNFEKVSYDTEALIKKMEKENSLTLCVRYCFESYHLPMFFDFKYKENKKNFWFMDVFRGSAFQDHDYALNEFKIVIALFRPQL